jgi:hypothetical protein
MSGYLVAFGGKADIKPRTGGQYEYTPNPASLNDPKAVPTVFAGV